MIYHTIYTMTIGELSRLQEADNINLIKRFPFWAPMKATKKAYRVFNTALTELFNQRELDKMLGTARQMVFLVNQSTMLSSLYQGLGLNPSEDMLAYYEANYGKKYTGIADLKVLAKDIAKLNSRLKAFSLPTQTKKEKTSFEVMIAAVEQLLGIEISYDMKVYQFKYKYDKAVAKSKDIEKQRTNG